MAHVVTLHFQTNPVLQRIIRKQVAAAASAAGADGRDAGRLELAVDEALLNAHNHAYGGTPGPIELEIAFEQKRLAITIHDEGEGLSFYPRIPDPPDPRIGATGTGYRSSKHSWTRWAFSTRDPTDEAQRFVWRFDCRSPDPPLRPQPYTLNQILLFEPCAGSKRSIKDGLRKPPGQDRIIKRIRRARRKKGR